jgi:membrane peptidoglycan carboxypeptidase
MRTGAGRGGNPEATVLRDRGDRPAAAKVNSLYDTVDQAALRRVDVRERTGDATTYQKVASDLDEVEPAHRAGRRAGAAATARPGQGRRGPKWWRNRPRWFRRLVLIGMFSSFLLLVAGVAVVYAATKVPLPGEVKTDQTSIITYAGGTAPAGREEIARIGVVNRTDVPLSEVSKDAQHAVLAAENRNFYNEPGISYRGIARALWTNIRGGEISQGGSTITQQYAKNAYLTQERTFSRKIREIALAVKLDKKYSKDQILEFYLNTIYFGRGAYGIEAAANTYFGIHAKDLTAEQGAVIAGLIRSPNYLDPRVTPAVAARRWHEVMNTMVSQGWLPADRAGADKKPPVTNDRTDNSQRVGAQASYIRDQVRRELTANGITEDQINRGGLRIQTTLDYGRQQAAYNAVVSQIGPAYAAVPDLRTGLVATEPATGRVLAWYGGSLYGKGTNGQQQYEDNVSTAKVPPGSTFKAITLVTALQNGVNLHSVFPAPAKVELPGNYVVQNDETNVDFGYRDLIFATAESLNTVYVPLGCGPSCGVATGQAAADMSIAKVVANARAMGIPNGTTCCSLTTGAGVTLGQDDVHALDMATVYNTLANRGIRTTPHIVDKVTDGSGRTIYQGQGSPQQVLSPAVVDDATFALESVLTDGTGKSAKLANNRPAAGKTGTTSDFRSAWFCGYTPQISSCVNMFRGKGTNQELLKNIPGANGGVYGGTYPAKIWKAFMDGALATQQVQQFNPPVNGGKISNLSPSPAPTPAASPTTDTGAGTVPGSSPTDPGSGPGRGHGRRGGDSTCIIFCDAATPNTTAQGDTTTGTVTEVSPSGSG